MDRLMWNAAEFQLLYNCSFYNVSDIPLQERRNIPMGVGELIVILLELILYIPCMFSIRRHLKHSCYKIMLVMGVYDVAALFCYSIGALFHCIGVVYCSSPTLMYILGCIQVSLFNAETHLELILAVNRCVYFKYPDIGMKFFRESDQKTWALTIVPILIGFVYFVFGQPAPYSGIMGMWSLNPHYAYTLDIISEYTKGRRVIGHYINALIMSVALPLIYTVFYFAVKKTVSNRSPENTSRKYTKPKSIFYQVFIISVLNFVVCLLIVISNHVTIPKFLFDPLMHVFFWTAMQIHGVPPVIYLWFNRQVQKDVKKMMEPVQKLHSKVFK